MPQQLEQIVQRMIDAGEPEDNIASVIKEYPKTQPSLASRVGRAALDTLPGIGGIVGGALSTPETFGIGTVPGAALGVGAGQGLRDLIGHYTGLDAPTTPMEKAGRIAKETAVAGATGALLPGVAEAIKTPIQTTREAGQLLSKALPQSVRRLGNMIPSLPKGAPAPILERPAFQTWGRAVEETAAARPETTASGTGFLRTGPAPTGEPSWNAWKVERPAGAAATPSAQPLTAAERSSLASRGFTPEAIAKVEQAAAKQSAAPVASHTPTPSAPTPVDAPSPLQQPRVQVGAERVGRANGLTKQEVRTQTGPVLDEAVGDASPILPKKALQRIIDDMKALPKEGPEREAYVARATSGKTKSQVENVRRTLEHLGLIVPFAVAAPTLRDELQRLMSSHGQTGS